MPTSDINLADRSGSLIESQKNYQPRVVFFYLIIALLLAILTCGLAYEQLFRSDVHEAREARQNQRRIITPGPRGDILDREGKVIVGNRAPWSLIVYLDELKPEFLREARIIHRNYVNASEKNPAALAQLPTNAQYSQIARAAVLQRYLDRVSAILGRPVELDRRALEKHFFSQELLLPYVILADLEPDDTARLLEQLPVNSPLEVFSSNTRSYPYGSAAAHTIGRVKPDDPEKVIELEGFGEDNLRTYKMAGITGSDGLEARFESLLQGQPGGKILQVDPAGFRINKPLEERAPVKGRSLATSIDIDLQLAAEKAIDDHSDGMATSFVALDVRTGEVLALASKPDYDLNEVSPRMSLQSKSEMDSSGAWLNRAISGLYPPGSTFKTLVSIAGMRSGKISITDTPVTCIGQWRLGNKILKCDNGLGHHGAIALVDAIAESCDTYFWYQGVNMGADIIAAEARRFHLDQRTGIELPGETRRMNIPDAEWKKRVRDEPWTPGDTANISIGQGDLLVTPLQMACYAASLARNEVYTKPTLIHDPNAPVQHSEPIGLTAAQRQALLDGMEGCITSPGGTAYNTLRINPIRGLRIAGKTGTAQVTGKKNIAWFICFAPLENPQIAIAVAMEGDTAGETTAGGSFAAPMAQDVLRAWWEKKNRPAPSQPAGLTR